MFCTLTRRHELRSNSKVSELRPSPKLRATSSGRVCELSASAIFSSRATWKDRGSVRGFCTPSMSSWSRQVSRTTVLWCSYIFLWYLTLRLNYTPFFFVLCTSVAETLHQPVRLHTWTGLQYNYCMYSYIETTLYICVFVGTCTVHCLSLTVSLYDKIHTCINIMM